ncbi:MAG: phosphatase PAP2 family protein [Planctomycetes bacterium]|nr:phosphatase PAP2 family protein [Planctomycetota bacterium]
MLHKRWRTALLCVPLVWALGCTNAPEKKESKTVAEVVEEVKQEKEAEQGRQVKQEKKVNQEKEVKQEKNIQQEKKSENAAATPAEPAPKKDWKQHAKEDWGDLGHNLKEDIMGLWAKEDIAHNLIVLGGAGGLVAVSVNNWDQSVARYYDEHDALGGWEEVGYELGKPEVHFGVMGLFYTYAKLADDPKSLETSKRLAEALILNGVTTLILKGAVGRTRPNGRNYSFPSGHSSSSFATAAVLSGMYGPRVGIPLYLLSSFIAFSRLDGHDHYLSDVIFGSALGYVIGRTVTKTHEREVLGFEVAPWIAPEEQVGGVMFQRRF